MAHRAVYAALRPVARFVSAPAPSQTLARAAIASHPTASPSLILIRTKKTKPSKKADSDPDAGRGAGGNTGKKSGKGKGKMLTEDDLLERQLPGEHFELKVLEGRMQEAIDRLRVSLNTVVGRVGRITPGESERLLSRFPPPFSRLQANAFFFETRPALLDGVKIDTPEGKRPLLEFANVSVKDGRDLVVTCYEESVRSSPLPFLF